MSGATSADFAGSMMSATWPVPSRTAPCMSSQTPRTVRSRERICGSPSSCAARTRAAKPCAWKGSRRWPTSDRGYVLSHGEVVLDRGAQELRADEQLLVASYLGEQRAADATG